MTTENIETNASAGNGGGADGVPAVSVPVQQAGETNKEYDSRISDMQKQIDALLAQNKAVIDEKRAEKEKARQAVLNAETKTKEEADNIIQQYKKELEDRDNKLSQYAKEKQDEKLDGKAREIAEKLAKTHPGKAKQLAKEVKARIRLSDDGEVQVLDKQGNLTISQVDSLVNELKTEFDFLVDGVQSAGGGVHSSAGAPVKSFKEMNSDERTKLWNDSPQKYEQLKAASK